jgi:DNA polymerase IV
LVAKRNLGGVMPKTILHVDINSYFATLLQQENPALRGRPVGVIKDEGRTCIIAASKEAKKLGIATGSSSPEAKVLCPDLLLIPASFERYLDATKRMKQVFEKFSPDVFIYSLDEAFIDVTNCRQHLYKDVQKLGLKIQQEIKNELGSWVTTNVGIGNNRLRAKIASEIAPKGTLLEINEKNLDPILASISFRDVCGIGFRLERKLQRLRIKVPYQIRFYEQAELESLFGPFWSKELLKIAYGLEPHFLKLIDKPVLHMKSVGRSITGFKLCDSQTEMLSILFNLCSEVVDKVRHMGLAGRQIWLGLYGQERRFGKHTTLQYHICHLKEMFDEVKHLYNHWSKNFKVIKFAVRLNLLEPNYPTPILPSWHHQERIQTALDWVNTKYGIFTLHPAAINRSHLIRPEVTGFLGDREYQLK